jgi:hypothetical protein
VTVMLDGLRELLRKRVPKDDDSPGCQLCKWILLDLEANAGKLKGWNMDFFNQPIFSKKGEIAHLKLEGFPFVESEL